MGGKTILGEGKERNGGRGKGGGEEEKAALQSIPHRSRAPSACNIYGLSGNN